MTDEAAMRLALAQARRALGRVFPNPPVGAVVYRGARVLGRGYTRPPGGPHAEVVAIRAASRRFGARALRGASLAVTLEPCSFVGRTGPCADAVVAAGIRRVVVGHADPHPRVSGAGLRRLRRAGLEVSAGVLERACRAQHRGFLSLIERGRPHVTLKLAATLDGRIATSRGESRWISGPRALALVHRLRARADGVMVGAETALADDPELNARRDGRILHRPVRVLVDSRLRVPPARRLFREDGARTWVLCARAAPAVRRRRIERSGARLLEVPRSGQHVDLRAALGRLGREGLTTLLVEGGGGLAAALLRSALVDELHWLVSPRLLGGDGVPALSPIGAARLADAIVLDAPRVRRIGADVHVAGLPRRAGDAAC